MSPAFAIFDTAIGPCAIAWNDQGILCTQLPEGDEAKTRSRLKRRIADAAEAAPSDAVRVVIERIVALLKGGQDNLADIVIQMDGLPDFNRKVYEIARTIPPGETLTYGDIARQLGGLALARDVGQALGKNPFPIIVPCHRVLAAGGKSGGFSARGGAATKLKMLAIEGAYVNHTPSLFGDQPAGRSPTR